MEIESEKESESGRRMKEMKEAMPKRKFLAGMD
jgi:hypothetical protein